MAPVRAGRLLLAPLIAGSLIASVAMSATATAALVPGGSTLVINVPEALGGKTVIGQLTVDQAVGTGFVTAYPCGDGPPTDAAGAFRRSDLNFDARVSRIASNRLLVEADDQGDICVYTSQTTALIVDVNAVSFDTGFTSFANRRTDTRAMSQPLIAAGTSLRISIPEAVGGRIVAGQLTVDRANGAGYVTAYPCVSGPPRDANGAISRSDLNYDSQVSRVASNRLVVQADATGAICLYTSRPTAMIVDINAVGDSGIAAVPDRRIDTRAQPEPVIAAETSLRITVPEAVGGRTVLGQLTVDRASGNGYVTAYPCASGVPRDPAGGVSRSDLNYDSRVSRVASNRLVVQADASGAICLFTSRPTAMIVDINAVADAGISSFPNRRYDSRAPQSAPGGAPVVPIPVWPTRPLSPALDGRAALTGLAVPAAVSARGIIAVKIDNYSRARPPWGLDQADVVIEENVEGVTRFIALFHSTIGGAAGPVRSARTADIDVLAAMNRPTFVYSGANAITTEWIRSAANAGVLVDLVSPRHGCFTRTDQRPGPHNLLVDLGCVAVNSGSAGPARPLFDIDAGFAVGALRSTPDTRFRVRMDGVRVEWAWDPDSQRYLRWQDDAPHLAESGVRITAHNVVEIAAVHVPSPADARTPSPITVGTGPAIIHRDGRAIVAVWSRATISDPFRFVEVSSGQAIPLDTGRTFIEVTRV